MKVSIRISIYDDEYKDHVTEEITLGGETEIITQMIAPLRLSVIYLDLLDKFLTQTETKPNQTKGE